MPMASVRLRSTARRKASRNATRADEEHDQRDDEERRPEDVGPHRAEHAEHGEQGGADEAGPHDAAAGVAAVGDLGRLGTVVEASVVAGSSGSWSSGSLTTTFLARRGPPATVGPARRRRTPRPPGAGRPRPGGPGARVVGEEAGEGRGDRDDVLGAVDHEAGLAVEHGLGRAAAPPGDGGHAARRPPRGTRCRSPPARGPRHRLRHSMAKHVGARRRATGRSSSGTRPRNRTGRPGLAASRSRRLAVAAGAGDGDLEVGAAGGQGGGGLDEHVDALAGHEPADADHERRVGVEAEAARARPGARRRRAGWKRSGSTPGRHDDGRQVAARGPARLGRRVAAGGDDQVGRRAAPGRSSWRVPGSRPGTVTSAPCSTTP